MNVDAVFSDLDGTFWAKQMQVHQATLDAVTQFDQAGVPLIIATGRRGCSALAGLSRYGLNDRPAILMNGGIARDRIDGPSFLVETIESEAAVEIVDLFEDHGLEPLVYIDDPDADMVLGPRPSAGLDFVESAVGVSNSADLRAACRASKVIGFGAFGFPKGQLEMIANAINESGWATAVIGLSILEGDHGIMLQAPNTDKATGIAAYCARHQIDVTRIAAIGDGSNDIEMLELAHIAIVPTDAPDDIRDLANHLIEPNEVGGWEALPELLGFKP